MAIDGSIVMQVSAKGSQTSTDTLTFLISHQNILTAYYRTF